MSLSTGLQFLVERPSIKAPRPGHTTMCSAFSTTCSACSHGAAYCTGRGEVVEDVQPPLPLTMPILLVGCCQLCWYLWKVCS